MGWYYDYKPYVPVAQRRVQAAREVEKRRKAGQKISPVVVEGQKIAKSFWGLSWCTNLERYSDYANRLPRGRTYVRNGSVVDLQIAEGKITALVSGSELYTLKIEVAPLPKARWEAFKKRCSGAIGSLVELLQGKLSKDVMALATDPKEGLFPAPSDIKLSCSCPDGARMCKHVAAVMYGVGNRLDASPELLFVLRGVNHEELIEQALPASPTASEGGSPTIAADDLGSIFGIEIDDAAPVSPVAIKPAARAPKKKSAKAAEPAKKAPAASVKSGQGQAAGSTAASRKSAKKSKATVAKESPTASKPATAPKRATVKKVDAATAKAKAAAAKTPAAKKPTSPKQPKSKAAARKK
ncbi:SWIM zinc finger family protein [Paludisphaera rhizosphaerae]|nr:SWIM zinc finger family protein [Paludisphaera rhizosphaerae]